MSDLSKINKKDVLTVATIFSIVKNAVKQVTNYSPESGDRIVFNSVKKNIINKEAK